MVSLGLGAVQADAGSKRLQETVDPYNGQKSLTLEVDTGRCVVETSPDPNAYSHVRLILSAIQQPQGDIVYALVVDMDGGHKIHPGKHGEMETVIDGAHGELHPLADKSYWREPNSFSRGRHMRETIPFGVDRDFVAALAKAQTFQFRVVAADTTLERCTDAKKLRDLNDFLGMSSTL
jgi:hypothetical protein